MEKKLKYNLSHITTYVTWQVGICDQKQLDKYLKILSNYYAGLWLYISHIHNDIHNQNH